jgi:hypothetical protein
LGDNRPQQLLALRQIAGVLAGVCAFTTLGSLAVCLFSLPDAWPMVIVWACLTGVFWVYSQKRRPAPDE